MDSYDSINFRTALNFILNNLSSPPKYQTNYKPKPAIVNSGATQHYFLSFFAAASEAGASISVSLPKGSTLSSN